MTVPTTEQAQEFFQSDIIISAIVGDRFTYWISDIEAKGIVDENDFGKLYFNAFMNLLGHYLLIYETQYVSYRGAVTSEHTSQVSRNFQGYTGNNPMEYDLSMTKYGRIFASLLSRISVTKGGFVTGGCGYV